MKYLCNRCAVDRRAVAPVRERGLKLPAGWRLVLYREGRSRKGAWIEIMSMTPTGIFTNAVAPVRERGLKFDIRQEDTCTERVALARERGLK